MRKSCFAVLVLVCSLFTSGAEAGMGFSVEINEGGTYVETAPPAVIYTPPPVVYYEQGPVEVYEYNESYQSDSCYDDECYSKHRKGHHRHHRHHNDDDD